MRIFRRSPSVALGSCIRVFGFSFRKVNQGGYSMDPDPTKAMSAKSINSRFSRCAESAGLKPKGGRGISFTGFRTGLATEVRRTDSSSTAEQP